MAKMHELLAVEASVAGNLQRDVDETLKVFGRPEAFRKTSKAKVYFAEEDQKLNTNEVTEITTTVQDRLNWFSKHAVKFFDLVLQKDKTNQKAAADLVVDGVTLATNVPATTLLMLESKLQEVRKVLDASPTLPSTVRWSKDDVEGLWVTSDPVVTFTTKKVAKPVVLYEATKEHPAQVKEVSEDVPVAKITQTTWQGMLTATEKATLLGRLDTLLQSVKKARQRANTTDVEKANFGSDIFGYLFNGVVTK
jgi:hypothetical protein